MESASPPLLNKPIIAAPGDDVILPCRLDSEEDLQDHFLEWIKLEMDPDPIKRRFVYLYLNRKIMTRFMMETFIQRVSLNPDGLKRGDVTLKIRNVTLQDEGKYRCYIPGKNLSTPEGDGGQIYCSNMELWIF
uniref:Ig-like domain-containing protein n=1 Tax=Oryzias melastigma TaxID=30732 RepID=A0A3B3C6J0_ORYME